jgi:hypothetical protein
MGSKCYLTQPSGHQSWYFSQKAVPVQARPFRTVRSGGEGMARVFAILVQILLRDGAVAV